MAIVVEVHASNDNVGDDNLVTVDMPTTRPTDNLYLACIGGDSEDYTWSGNANFTDLVISESGNNQIGGACFYSGYKIGGASEPASYDFTRSSATAENMLCAMLRFSGVDTTTPIGATSTANIGNAVTATAPAITATSDDSIILRIYAADTDNVVSYASATDIYHTTQGNGWGNIAIAYEASPGNGVTTGTEDATLDAQDAWVAWTVEIMPASAALHTLSGTVNSQSASIAGSITDFTVNTLSGTVNSQSATVTSSINNFTVNALSGNVSSQSATVAGSIDSFSVHTLSGTVNSQQAVISGSIDNFYVATLSGTINAQNAGIAGTVNNYPLSGWNLTDFTVDYAGLDPDSPYTDAQYSALVAGDKAHYENTLTPESSVTVSMNGLGEYTVTGTVTVTNTFQHQIYTALDGTFGTVATITVEPQTAVTLSGTIAAQAASIAGNINDFTVNTLNGSVSAQSASVTGNINNYVGHTLSGTINAQNASIAGSLSNYKTLSGTVNAQDSSISGNLNSYTLQTLSGNVTAQNASIAGSIVVGDVIVLGGTVAAQSASISGTISNSKNLSGVVQSQDAGISGVINRVIDFQGTVQSQSATINGVVSLASDHTTAPKTANYYGKFKQTNHRG